MFILIIDPSILFINMIDLSFYSLYYNDPEDNWHINELNINILLE